MMKTEDFTDTSPTDYEIWKEFVEKWGDTTFEEFEAMGIEEQIETLAKW